VFAPKSGEEQHEEGTEGSEGGVHASVVQRSGLGGSATSFEDVWLRAGLVDSRERLHPLFTAVRQVAAEQP